MRAYNRALDVHRPSHALRMKSPKKTFDLSVVLNLHREAPFLARTFRSLSEAANFAKLDGISIELVIVLDCADAETTRLAYEYAKPGFDAIQIVEVENRCLGLSRNSGCEIARGEYFCPQDGDDLVSFNYFSDLLRTAKERGRDIVLFPEWLIGFGEQNWTTRYDDASRARLYLVDEHPFNSRAFFHRSLFDVQKYVHPDKSKGEAYEDWIFNATAVSNGFSLEYAPGVVLFYRQHAKSIMASARSSSVRLEIPHNPLFEPDRYLECFPKDYDRHRKGMNPPLTDVSVMEAIRGSEEIAVLAAAANRIDPAINLDSIQNGGAGLSCWSSPEAGAIYYDLCKEISGRKFTDVFILPFLVAGGGERFIIDVMKGLGHIGLASDVLVITGEHTVEHAWRRKLPGRAHFIDMFAAGGDLTAEQRYRLTLRLIQATAPTARVHIKSSVFGHGLISRYKTHLHKNRIVYYRFCDEIRSLKGVPQTGGSQVEFISEHIDSLFRIVSDNNRTIFDDRNRFSMHNHKWMCLPAHVDPEPVKKRRKSPARKLIWASRLTSQKRPELLTLIAKKLAREMPDVTLDIYGTIDADCAIDVRSLRYKGRYNGISEIPMQDYDALVYTAWYDGLPNVVLEFMAAGVPVIAPDVGGISEAVSSWETGILIESNMDDEHMANLYVAAIKKFYEVDDWSSSLAERALEYIRRRHGHRDYLNNIRRIYE